MTVVTMEEAKERLEELAGLAEGGEEVVIMQGEALAWSLQMVPTPAARVNRQPGMWKGRVEIRPDFFDAMGEEELDLWEGNSPRGRKLEENGHEPNGN